ncbi:MAG: histidine phosphatase family protein [Terracoccus sp.]
MSTAGSDKTLVLVRHAKAEEGQGKADHDRELTNRGRRDAEAAGAWLHGNGLGPDLVIASTSERTRQTWDSLRRGGIGSEFVEFRHSVYLGGSEQVLDTVREDGSDADTVLVIGHNPTMAQLTSLLCDGQGSREAHAALADGFVTCGVAVLRYAGPWADLDLGTCELDRFHVGRG